MARRSTFAAGALALAVLCLCATAARAQDKPADKPADAPADKAAPAPLPAPDKDAITVTVTNACDKTILAAVVLSNLKGEWEPQGFWRLAPGETAEAGKTKNRTYYVYAHELGDAECARGCWAGNSWRDLQGDKWPFVEKDISPGAGLGSIVNHKFTC